MNLSLSESTIIKGFIAAGITNFTVLLFSKLFTNSVIPAFDAQVMSTFGLVMIVVWGMAYLAVAKTYTQVKWLVAVFALEKLAYGIAWIHWHIKNDVSTVFNKDLLAGLFFSSYGAMDLVFCLFFTLVFYQLTKQKK